MNQTIFVTGSHRSGSTWVGKIISSSKEVRYVHEPFNMNGINSNSPIKNWFEYISDNSDPIDQQEVLDYLESFYATSFKALSKKLLAVRNGKELFRFCRGLKGRYHKRTLIKDPIAIFSTEWIYKNLHSQVLICIRHPAAFIASLKVKDWQFDFNHYLNQKTLMEDYLGDYANDIDAFANGKVDIIKQGALIWNSMYSTVLQMEKKYNNKWLFVKHEDLSRDPMLEFSKIFNYLNLEFTDNMKTSLAKSTSSGINTKLKRNSKENILSWKKRLTNEEVEYIKKETREVWSKFYTETDW